MNTSNLLAFLSGGYEWIVIALVGLLIFGRRLPFVARNLGSSINEFKAGLKDPVKPQTPQIDERKSDPVEPESAAKKD